MPTLSVNPISSIVYEITQSNLGNINQPELKSTTHPFRKEIHWNNLLDTFFTMKSGVTGSLPENPNNSGNYTLVHDASTDIWSFAPIV